MEREREREGERGRVRKDEKYHLHPAASSSARNAVLVVFRNTRKFLVLLVVHYGTKPAHGGNMARDKTTLHVKSLAASSSARNVLVWFRNTRMHWF